MVFSFVSLNAFAIVGAYFPDEFLHRRCSNKDFSMNPHSTSLSLSSVIHFFVLVHGIKKNILFPYDSIVPHVSPLVDSV